MKEHNGLRSFHILENSQHLKFPKLQGHLLHPSVIMLTVTTPRHQGSAWNSLFKIQGKAKHILERLPPRKTKTKIGDWRGKIIQMNSFPVSIPQPVFYYVRFYLKEKKVRRFIIYSWLQDMCIYEHMLVNFVNICVYIYKRRTFPYCFKWVHMGVYMWSSKFFCIRRFFKSMWRFTYYDLGRFSVLPLLSDSD